VGALMTLLGAASLAQARAVRKQAAAASVAAAGGAVAGAGKGGKPRAIGRRSSIGLAEAKARGKVVQQLAIRPMQTL
jgi:hypothetical protein